MQKQSFYPDYRCDIGITDEEPYQLHTHAVQRDSVITSLHDHPVHEFGFCLEGAGVFIVADKIMEFKKGDAISIAAGEPHLAQSVSGTISRWHWIYLDADRLLLPHFPELDTGLLTRLRGKNFHNILDGNLYPVLCGRIGQMGEIRYGKNELAALTVLAVLEMKARFSAQIESGEELERNNTVERVRKAVQYFLTHYSGKVSIPDAAKLCGLSTPHFRRLFHQALGCSPQCYLNTIRIQMAVAELQKRKRGIGEVALDCGFDSLSSFNRQFRRIKGCSPRELLCHQRF